MRPLAVVLVLVLVLSSLVPLLGEQLHDVQAASFSPELKIFHLHDGPDYTAVNYYDWMNSTGPANPPNTNYENQNPPIDGVSIRKNPSPNHRHFWVMYPGVSSAVTFTGNMSAHLWARSRGNQSGTLITATFSDQAPGEAGNPGAWTNIGQVTVPLTGPTYSDFNPYDLTISGVSYTLAAGHALVLTVQRGDSFNDQLIVMFDTTAKDSYVSLTTSSSVSVNAAWAEDASHTPSSVFSDLENINVGANVSDPFGAYDIVGANASVAYSANSTVVLPPTPMSSNRTDPAQPPYWKGFGLTLPNLPHGVFTINVTASDNQGVQTWFTFSITVVTVDHFSVSGPARAVAGQSFALTVTALDASNATITNWVGTVQLQCYFPDKTTLADGTLSIPTLDFTVGDQGQVTNSSVNYSGGEQTILIRASSGPHYGWSSPMHVSSGPVINIQVNALPSSTVAAGSSLTMIATGHDALNNVNSTWTPRWIVIGGIGNISGAGTSVTFEARAIGVGNITCVNDYNGVNSTIEVTVTVGGLARIDITAVSFDPQQIPEGESCILTATGYDAVGNTLTLDNITWDTDTAGSIHAIGWGPTADFTAGYIPESGLINVRKGSIVGTIEVTIIDSPDGPSFSTIPPQYANENSETWNLGLSGYWHDRDGTGNLVWWADNVNTSLFFVSHDQTSNSVIVFHTQLNQFGDSTFDLWAVDPSGYRAHTTVTVHIVHVNQPPAFVNNPPTTLYVKFDTQYIFDFSYYVSDIDNAKSQLTLKSSSSSIFFDGLNATFMFPRRNGDQSYFVLVTLNLSDGQATAELKIVVWVTSDTPPSLVKNLESKSIYEGTLDNFAFDLDNYFTDVDNQTLYYSYGFHHVHVYIDPQTHDVFLSAPEVWSGTEEGIFTATDPTGALQSDTVDVTVIPVDYPPKVIQDINTVFVKYNQTYYLYLSPFIMDPDNSLSSLIFNIDNTHVKQGVSLSGAPRLELLFPPSADPSSFVFTGAYTVEVNMTISDGNLSTPCTFFVRVTGDSPPQVAVQNPDQLYYSFPENSYLNNSLLLYDLFSDPDDSTLTFYISGQDHVFTRLFTNGDVNLTSLVNWSGTEALTVRAIDSKGAWSLVQVFVVVTPVNQAPVIYPIPDIINKGDSFRIAHYPIFQYVYDSDNPISSLTFTVTPAGNAFVVGGYLYVSLPDGVKTIIVTLQASDGKLSSNVVSFKVGIATTMAEKIGWPYSFPLLLLGAGVAAFFVASRIPRPYALENLFLIHNDGRLVSNVSREENTTLDKDVVSAMFTAVQEFVHDSFQKGEVGLKKLEIGDKNVVIEKGRSAYLALIYSGYPAKDTFSMLPMLMSDIEERYKERLEKWNGTAKTVKGVDRMLQDYMSDKFQPGMWHDEEEMAEKEWVDILDKEA